MPEPTRRLALLVEYDGTGYAGSQWQANGPSIQAELEQAIAALTGAFARVAFAGRTDAGVHAGGQVAAFSTATRYPCAAFVGGLNVRLPRAIAVRAAVEVAPEFDPRRQACGRRYRYTIVNSAVRSPLWHARAWQVRARLDQKRMQATASVLGGEHDFAAFAPPEASRFGSRRWMQRVDVRRDGRLLTLEFEANAFLMHQVRRMTAALVEVGAGRLEPEDFAAHLYEARPGAWTLTAPAHGLCLEAVNYDPPLFAGIEENVDEDL